MLFGYITDEKYVDLIDENGKLFRRFRTQKEYDDFCRQFSPADLWGLHRRETLVKWWDSNWQIAKLVIPIVLVVGSVLTAI